MKINNLYFSPLLGNSPKFIWIQHIVKAKRINTITDRDCLFKIMKDDFIHKPLML